jgi:sugar lactone lactonase YvrE
VGEGPTCSGLGNAQVMWVDILGQKYLTKDLVSGQTTEVQVNEDIGFALPTDSGGVLMGVNSGPIVKTNSGLEYRVFDRGIDLVPTRWNDAKISPSGELYAGTMAYSTAKGTATLFHYSPATGRLKPLLTGLTIANGMDWSPITGHYYFIDSASQGVDELVVSDGQVLSRRTVITFSEANTLPDGMTIDSTGGFWIAMWGGSKVLHFDCNFVLQEMISLPTSYITSCCFVGPNLNQLVITSSHNEIHDSSSAGMTFILDIDASGQPQNLASESDYLKGEPK